MRTRTVHPHACGEYVRNQVDEILEGGSPPRVWGMLPPGARLFPIIAVHPHACGEYARLRRCRWLFDRFTPTRVGNTYSCNTAIIPPDGSPPRVWGIHGKFRIS